MQPTQNLNAIRQLARTAMHRVLAPVFRQMVRGKEIWYFEGIRRSGNHACIYWLANARLGRKVTPQRLNHHAFYQLTPDLLFINSYAQTPALKMMRQTWKQRSAIRRSKVVFLSLEDESSDLVHFLNLKRTCDYHIGITRWLPNVFASRLKKFETESQRTGGGISGNFAISETTLDLFFAAREAPYVWVYDSWLEDARWRRTFIAQLGLDQDLKPAISHHAGGSSFGNDSGQNQRHTETGCPDSIKALVARAIPRLTEGEQETTERWMQRNA